MQEVLNEGIHYIITLHNQIVSFEKKSGHKKEEKIFKCHMSTVLMVVSTELSNEIHKE